MSPRFATHELGSLASKWHEQQVRLSSVLARQAHILSDVVELALAHDSSETDLVLRSYAAELAAVSRVSDRTILRQLHEAHELVTEYPLIHRALSCGEIGSAHARTIVEEGTDLPSTLRQAYAEKVLPLASSTTAGRLRSRAARIAESLKPICLEDRHRRAASERRVWVRDLPDGMAELHAEIPAVLAYGIFDRLTRSARVAKREAARQASAFTAGDAVFDEGAAKSDDPPESDHDARTLDQFRADTLCELLLTSVPANPTEGTRSVAGIVPQITVVIPATKRTLAALQRTNSGAADSGSKVSGTASSDAAGSSTTGSGAANSDGTNPSSDSQGGSSGFAFSGTDPAMLRGYGPIDAATARKLAAVAPGWDRVVVDTDIDSDTYGTAVSTDRYRLTEAMRRILEHRDQHCRFPGCRMPLAHCDVDHTVEWSQGGSTAVSNLTHLCRRHHSLKHPDLADDIRWKVKQKADGVLEWESPTGRRYRDHPSGLHDGDTEEPAPPDS